MGKNRALVVAEPAYERHWQVFVEANHEFSHKQSRLVVLLPPTADVKSLRGAAAGIAWHIKFLPSVHRRPGSDSSAFLQHADEITRKYRQLHPDAPAACTRVQIAVGGPEPRPTPQRFHIFDDYSLGGWQPLAKLVSCMRLA